MKIFSKISEKYKSMPVTAKVVFWFTIANFLQRGISIITTPIFTRILSTEQYGMFSVYTAWSDILVIIVTLNLHMSVMNNAFMKTNTTKERVVSSFQGLSCITSLSFLFVYLIFNNQINNLMGLPFSVVFAMFISFIFISPYNYWLIYKRYQYDYKKMAFVTVLVSLLIPVCGLIAVFFADSHQGEARILGKIFVVSAVGLFFMIVNWKKDHTFFDKDLWKYALVFNLPLIPHFLSETFLNQSDRIMINTFCGTSYSGIYSIAYTVASLMSIFASAVNTAMVPWQYEHLRDKKYNQLAKPVYYILIGLGLVSALMIILAPEIILVLAGEKYGLAVSLIPTLATSVFFNYLYQTLARVEMYYGKRIYTVIGTFSAAFVNVVLNYFLIPKFGFIVAGYTTLISHILLCIMHYYYYRKVCISYIQGEKIYSPYILLAISIAVLLVALVMTILYNYFILRIAIFVMCIIIGILFRKKIVNLIRSMNKQ